MLVELPFIVRVDPDPRLLSLRGYLLSNLATEVGDLTLSFLGEGGVAGRGSINFATDRKEPTLSLSKEGNKKNAAYYSSRAWAICQLRKITGISPTNKIAKAGTEASTNLSSDAY